MELCDLGGECYAVFGGGIVVAGDGGGRSGKYVTSGG